MFEPPPRPSRSWFWPALVIAAAGFLAAAAAFGGRWYLIGLAVALLWGFFGIRFLLSSRGKRILFSRFDRSDYTDPRGN
jgi:hypothetical protein